MSYWPLGAENKAALHRALRRAVALRTRGGNSVLHSRSLRADNPRKPSCLASSLQPCSLAKQNAGSRLAARAGARRNSVAAMADADACTEDAKPPSPKDVVKVLAELGYVYKAPEGGTVSDERLTQVDDETKGFEWKGQENYDAVAAACALYCKTRLVLASGLMETALGEARCWAHPNDAGPNAPIIFLVCGSFPGGSAGVWGRSLCVNATLREGGMFD